MKGKINFIFNENIKIRTTKLGVFCKSNTPNIFSLKKCRMSKKVVSYNFMHILFFIKK